jgi:hypothetical protein
LNGAGVTFDGVAATNVNVVDQGTITAATPSGQGTADVIVTNADTTTSTLTGGFVYVPPTAPIVTVTADNNPSVFGQSVTFTANVTSSVTPTGNVSFLDGVNTLQTVALDGSGKATYTTSALAIGTHAITVSYAGDVNVSSGSSPELDQVVNQAATTTALASSLNPSAVGNSVTFTATVAASAPGAGLPTGNIDFTVDGTSIGTIAVDGTGMAQVSTTTLTAGNHDIVATYVGDTNFTTSASSTLVQSVGLNATTTALQSSLNPSTEGQSVTFTATVSGTGGPPTGSVTFKSDGTSIGVGTLDNGVATLSTSALSADTHSIVAVYSGDATFATSTSTPVSQVVNAVVVVDAGTDAAVDAGSDARVDSGTGGVDSGTDAGTTSSSGSTASSSGSTTSSSGSTSSSSGTTSSSSSSSTSSSGGTDAGKKTTGGLPAAPSITSDDSGCSCNEAGTGGSALSGLFGLFIAAAFVLRKRRA